MKMELRLQQNPVFTMDQTPCGRPVFCTDKSDWAGMQYPHPVTMIPMTIDDLNVMSMQAIRDDEGEVRYWVTATPDGHFMRIYND
jgi:hypothetical protein